LAPNREADICFAVASIGLRIMLSLLLVRPGLALAEALKTDLVFRLDLLHQAGASKLILATVLMDLALQLTEAEQGAPAEEMVQSFTTNFFRPQVDLH
jgi:hypothetical protein